MKITDWDDLDSTASFVSTGKHALDPDPPLTAKEFEQGYAERSRLTIEELRRWRVVATCDCGTDDCPGFQSISKKALKAAREEDGKTWEQVLP